MGLMCVFWHNERILDVKSWCDKSLHIVMPLDNIAKIGRPLETTTAKNNCQNLKHALYSSNTFIPSPYLPQ